MSGADDLAAAIKGPNTQAADRDVTAYDGQLVNVASGRPDGSYTGTSQVTVTVGDTQWQVTRLSGAFVTELNASGTGLIGRTVRVHMVNGQPEIAYTVDPAAGGYKPTWQALTQTLTINGVPNCPTDWAWYVTGEGVCELRFYIRTSGPSWPAVPFLTVPFPAAAPLPAAYPATDIAFGKHGSAVLNWAASCTVRLDTDRKFYVFVNGNPTSSGYIEGSMSYQT